MRFSRYIPLVASIFYMQNVNAEPKLEFSNEEIKEMNCYRLGENKKESDLEGFLLGAIMLIAFRRWIR